MSDSKRNPQLPAHKSLLLDNQVCFLLYGASNTVIRHYRPLLEKLDLTYPQIFGDDGTVGNRWCKRQGYRHQVAP